MSDDLSEKLRKIEEKIDSLIKMLQERLSVTENINLVPMKVEAPSGIPVNVYLFKLPESLRQTMFAMEKLKESTADHVAKESGRSRSLESIHLNQLERMGYLQKFRKGRKIYFKVPSPPKL